jgi:hypothetical protein
VQPWYAVTLLALATVAAQPFWAAVVVAGYPYFWAVILGHQQARTIGSVTYALALVVVLRGWRTRAPEPVRSGPPT